MPAIEAIDLKRCYRVHKKEKGVLGSIQSLFQRKYKVVKAVAGVSFAINKGELVGFIGPNGAGKTTVLKCLSGLLCPDAGKIEVLGFNPWQRRPEFLKQISLVMGQKNQLWWDLPPMETFLLNKEIYEIPDRDFDETLDALIELLELKEIVDVQVRKLSLGQRMKCELAACLLHSPRVLFLDEPTIGLDVVMQKKIRDFIRRYNQEYQATILLTSHNMSDVKKLCQRVIIIDKGQLIFDGPFQEITQRFVDEKIIKLVFSQKIDPKKLHQLGQLRKYNFPQAILTVKKGEVKNAAASLLKNFPVEDLDIEEPPIETVVRKIFTNKASDE